MNSVIIEPSCHLSTVQAVVIGPSCRAGTTHQTFKRGRKGPIRQTRPPFPSGQSLGEALVLVPLGRRCRFSPALFPQIVVSARRAGLASWFPSLVLLYDCSPSSARGRFQGGPPWNELREGRHDRRPPAVRKCTRDPRRKAATLVTLRLPHLQPTTCVKICKYSLPSYYTQACVLTFLVPLVLQR